MPNATVLRARLETYVEELKQSPADQGSRDVATRLTEILSETGPRLAPFFWTAEQQQALRVGEYITAHMGVYPPYRKMEARINGIECSKHDPRFNTYHLSSRDGCKFGHCGIERLDPRTIRSGALDLRCDR